MKIEIDQLHKGRLEALSDGVFAVVMTLLVLDLKPELVRDSKSTWDDLVAIKHILVIYAVTFTLAGVFWILQSRLLNFIQKATAGYAWLTLLFLFWITLLPFAFSLTRRADGMVLYFADMTLIGASLLVGWRYAHSHGLLATESESAYRFMALRIAMLVAGCLASMLLSFSTPDYSWLAVVGVVILGRIIRHRLA